METTRAVEEIAELENSVLVVAHPDDEVLWFSSLLSDIDKIVILFKDLRAEPELGPRRARAIAELPFEVACLEIPEVGTYGLADWKRPVRSPYGMVLDRAGSRADASRDYEANFHTIRTRLRRHLSAGLNVFTHNPWGEYGHEDHVQVYRVIESLRAEMGYALWVSSYISSRSQPLADKYAPGAPDPICRRIDTGKSMRIAGIYQRHRCWTWADDWMWDAQEYFLSCPVDSAPDARASPIAASPLLRWIPESVPGSRDRNIPS